MEVMTILNVFDIVLMALCTIEILYLFYFSLMSLFKCKELKQTSKSDVRIAVLVPAYNENFVIFKCVEAILNSDYPKHLYDVVVISDHNEDEVNRRLKEFDINVLIPTFDNSSKAKSLILATDFLSDYSEKKGIKYELITILDADNIISKDYLKIVTSVAFEDNMVALQAHRIAKNRNTPTAVLDSLSEEMNNSIFRKGHVNSGLASALIGSGMVFKYDWFSANIYGISSTGEDREIEGVLLKQGNYIAYLNDLYVLDEKISSSSAFYNQRRRWMSAQVEMLFKSLRFVPKALIVCNFNFCDKVIQWVFLPRSVLLGLVVLMNIVVPFIHNLIIPYLWLYLLILLLLSLLLAIPRKMYDKNLFKALIYIPYLIVLMILNLFRMKGAVNNFIHTEHTHDEESN